MEEKINIAEVLKNKPQGTKLYSPIFGNLRYEDLVPDLGEFTIVTSDNTSAKHSFRSDSRYNRHGEPLMLLPSKEMRDWSKFTWKKGDVLQKNSRTHVIFDSFVSVTYEVIRCKYFLKVDNGKEIFVTETNVLTNEYFKASEEQRQCYINKIEEHFGGKLNLETLEIEKSQSEFNDGDIVYAESDGFHYPSIHILNINGDTKRYYARLVINGRYDESIDYDIPTFDNVNPNRLRLATEEEKCQLFSALAKEGKAWDSEKKQIVVLKPKVEMKPFDKVLVRNCYTQRWRVNFFSSITKEGCYICASGSWNECIPYNEETAKLIGTTDNWEG